MMVSPVIFAGIIVNGEQEDQPTIEAYVAKAIEAGINYFDIAPSYGNAQYNLGQALVPYREAVYVACKTTERSAEGAKRELDQSLRELKTDHFDVYQLHALTTDEDIDQTFAKDGAFEIYLQAKDEGVIRNIGFSAHSERIALRACERYDFDTILFPFNWALGLETGWGDRIAEVAEASDKGVIAMKTMVDRMWRKDEPKVYPKSWCRPIYDNDRMAVDGIRYGFMKGAHVQVPPGNWESFNFMLKHIEEAIDTPLDEEELDYMREEARKIKDELIFTPEPLVLA